MRVVFEIKGKTPLVMHNIQLADKANDFVKQIAEINKKRTKTEEDEANRERLEWFGGLYFAEDIGVYAPITWIVRSLEEAGKITKQGKKVLQALAMTTDRVPLEYDGPRKPAELWARPEFRFRASVGVQRAKVMRMRPIFRNWALSFDAELLTDVMDLADLKTVAGQSGRSAGLGDARKLGYGRSEVTVVGENE